MGGNTGSGVTRYKIKKRADVEAAKPGDPYDGPVKYYAVARGLAGYKKFKRKHLAAIDARVEARRLSRETGKTYLIIAVIEEITCQNK